MWQISAPAPRYRDRISFLFDMSWIHFSNEKEWGNQKTVNTTQHTHNIHKHLTAASFSRISLCTLVYHSIRMKKKQKTKAKNGLAWGHRIYIYVRLIFQQESASSKLCSLGIEIGSLPNQWITCHLASILHWWQKSNNSSSKRSSSRRSFSGKENTNNRKKTVLNNW